MKQNKEGPPVHYCTSYCALQAQGVPWPAAAGPPGPGRHNNLSNSALAGLLIIITHISHLAIAYTTCANRKAFPHLACQWKHLRVPFVINYEPYPIYQWILPTYCPSPIGCCLYMPDVPVHNSTRVMAVSV